MNAPPYSVTYLIYSPIILPLGASLYCLFCFDLLFTCRTFLCKNAKNKNLATPPYIRLAVLYCDVAIFAMGRLSWRGTMSDILKRSFCVENCQILACANFVGFNFNGFLWIFSWWFLDTTKRRSWINHIVHISPENVTRFVFWALLLKFQSGITWSILDVRRSYLDSKELSITIFRNMPLETHKKKQKQKKQKKHGVHPKHTVCMDKIGNILLFCVCTLLSLWTYLRIELPM